MGKKILNPSKGISGGRKQTFELALGQDVGVNVNTFPLARETLY